MEADKNKTQVHKRRVRYKGTHPRKYSEKYKELNPEKYADTVAKVIRKGNTPAGMHISICVKEILDFLQIKPGQIGLDATLGYGGHTQKMLACLEGKGHIYGLDVDPIESVKTQKRLEEAGYGEEILTVLHMNFANIDEVAKKAGKFDFVLADLGVSSMQIDNPERGFSYKTDGPLDLRLNPDKGESAAERLMQLEEAEIEGMLVENADEPYAAELANAIVMERKKGNTIDTTNSIDTIQNVYDGENNLGIVRFPLRDQDYYFNILNLKELTYEKLFTFDYQILISKGNPLKDKDIYMKDLKKQIELKHGDIHIQEDHHNHKHMNIYERGIQFELLSEIPETYMWVAPMPKKLLKQNNFVLKACKDKKIPYVDYLIYRKGYVLSKEDQNFIECLKNGIEQVK